MTERLHQLPPRSNEMCGVKFVKPGDPDYPYALAHELSHHPLKGPDGKWHHIRGIVRKTPIVIR